LQNYGEAIRHYRAATRIKPDFSDAYINLGAVLESTGNIELAIDQYREAIRIEPHAEDVRQYLQALEKKVQADRAPEP
jgi:tetratricopeptide (TPR) repeat protein